MKEELQVCYNLLLNSMALSTEMGFRPYAGITEHGNFKVYWDFAKGKGQPRIYKPQDLDKAAAWIRESVINETSKTTYKIKNMFITEEEKV